MSFFHFRNLKFSDHEALETVTVVNSPFPCDTFFQPFLRGMNCMELKDSMKSTTSQVISSADSANSAIKEIKEAICQVKSEILNLQRTRDQCRVHLQQYEEDYHLMMDIYRYSKQIVDDITETVHDSEPAIVQSPQLAPDPEPSAGDESSEPPIPILPTDSIQMSKTENIQFTLTNHQKAGNQTDIKLKFCWITPFVICSVQYDPTGQYIAFSDGKLLHLITAQEGALMASIEIPRSANRNEMHTRIIRFSRDGQYIALSSMATCVSIFSTATKKCIGTLDGHKKVVSALLFLNDSTKLLSGSYDGMLCIWDLQAMALIRTVHHGTVREDGKLNREGAIVSLATDENETYIAVGFMNGFVGMYDSKFTRMNKFLAHTSYLLSIATIPNQNALVTTSNDKTAKVWTIHGIATLKYTFVSHSDYVLTTTISDSNPLIITGSKDETIKGWDKETGVLKWTLNCHHNTVFEIHHHPVDNSFVSCSGDGLVCVWDYVL